MIFLPLFTSPLPNWPNWSSELALEIEICTVDSEASCPVHSEAQSTMSQISIGNKVHLFPAKPFPDTPFLSVCAVLTVLSQ